MVGSISRYNSYTKLGMTSALELYNNIISDLFARKIKEGFAIEEKYPKSHELLDAVSRDHIISPNALLGKQPGDDRQLMTNAIHSSYSGKKCVKVYNQWPAYLAWES